MKIEDFKENGLWVKRRGPKGAQMATRAYLLWYSMKGRLKMKDLKPSYVECEISTEFRDFQKFAEWCQHQIGYGNEDWQLDKDLLTKGNKTYSPDQCVFVPREINMALVKCDRSRGNCKIGVYYETERGGYHASLRRKGRKKNLGLYATEDAAFSAYKVAKERYLKDLAEEFKEALDPRAYQALLNYEVDVDD